MNKHLRYLNYVIRHKWFVLLAGLQIGPEQRRQWPLWIVRLIIHDWTKFLPREWFPYTDFFYGGHMTRKKAAEQHYDFPVPEDVELAFEFAWNHHQHKNDHHWQYWIRLGDDGTTRVLPMSALARREMIADWRGAGQALGKPKTWEWYDVKKDKMQLHPDTRRWVNYQMTKLEAVSLYVAANRRARLKFK